MEKGLILSVSPPIPEKKHQKKNFLSPSRRENHNKNIQTEKPTYSHPFKTTESRL